MFSFAQQWQFGNVVCCFYAVIGVIVILLYAFGFIAVYKFACIQQPCWLLLLVNMIQIHNKCPNVILYFCSGQSVAGHDEIELEMWLISKTSTNKFYCNSYWKRINHAISNKTIYIYNEIVMEGFSSTFGFYFGEHNPQILSWVM